MTKIVKLRRGTTLQHSTFIGDEGETTVDTDKDCLVLHDGTTVGGFEHVNTSSNQRITNKDIVAVGLSVSGISTFSSNLNVIGISTFSSYLNVTGILTCGILTCNSIRIEGKLYDGDGDFGAAGQILSSDGDNLNWINASDANVGSATSIGINIDSVNTNRYVAFADTTTGTSVVRVDSDLTYNPSTNQLSVGVVTATTFFGNGTIPVGGIIMWSGSIANIPLGWALCNGSNGTPDLRTRFIVGAGSDAGTGETFNANTGVLSGQYAPGNTGGETAHQLTIAEMPSHSHTYSRAAYQASIADDSPDTTNAVSFTSSNTGGAGSDDYHENRPKYYALAFIMRTS